MRTTIAAAAIAASLLVPGPGAQAQGLFNRSRSAPATIDPNVNQANQNSPTSMGTGSSTTPARGGLLTNNLAPEPNVPEDTGPTIPPPTGEIEPYLISKANGPFMVLAYSFRGPNAPRQALALTLELRNQFHLPAYILLPKKFPGRSMIRGVPPQAPQFALKDDVTLPELLRTLDEAAVLVGDEKTVKDATVLMKKVKNLHPVSIDGVHQMWDFRKKEGLSRAIRTSNPLVPAEELFARQPDLMIGSINDGPHNIRNCPGRFTLQIASFNGRSSFDPDNDHRFKGMLAAKSPLATAADDAERLADALSKDKEIQKTGFQTYVYHDRFSSRVMIGSFDSPNDPRAQKLHTRLLEVASDLNNRKVTDTMIVPATALLDLTPIKSQLSASPTATARK